MLASRLPPSYLDTLSLCYLWDVRSYVWSLVFLLFEVILSSTLRMVLSILQRGTAQTFLSLMEFLLCSLVSSKFLVLMRYSFYFFFHLHLFDDVHFQYPHVLMSFLFSDRSDFSFIVFHFSLSAWYIFL